MKYSSSAETRKGAPSRVKPRIAIVADFPGWMVDETVPRLSWYFPTWLVSLYECFETVEEFDIHWIVFTKGIYRARTVQRRCQTFHLLPGGSLALADRTHYVWDEWRVKRLLRRLKPDLVHAWGTESRNAYCVRHLPYPKMLSVQGLLTVMHGIAPFSGFLYRQMKREVPTMRCFDLLTCESPWCRDKVKSLLPEKTISLLEYAVEQRFAGAARRLSPEPTCLIGCTPTYHKDVETAIKAFASPELSHVTLWLAGTPEGRFAALPPNVIPLGGVSRERMVELMSQAWCLVHPSLVDTGPTVVKEARLVGVPVVLTDQCGSQQYVEHGKSGFIIAPHDVEGLRQAVLHITQSAEVAQSMGEHGRRQCCEALSTSRMAERLLLIYKSMLAETAAAAD